MGSGDRVTWGWYEGAIGLGFYITKFPFAFTFSATIIKFRFSIGLGRAYDDPPCND